MEGKSVMPTYYLRLYYTNLDVCVSHDTTTLGILLSKIPQRLSLMKPLVYSSFKEDGEYK